MGEQGVDTSADRFDAFTSFTEHEWAGWLDRFVNGEPCAPQLRTGPRAAHDVLIGLWDRLPRAAAARMGRGAVRALQGTAVLESNAERLYTLLHLVAYTLPADGFDVVRQRLFERGLEGMSFAGQELDALALVVSGKYGVDRELREYIDRRAAQGASFDLCLAALRALSFRADEGAAAFLAHLPPVLEARPARVRALAGVLAGVVDRTGFASLYRWYTREWEGVTERGGHGARLLGDALLATCTDAADDDARMMRGELEAERRLLAWEELRAVMDVRESRGETAVQQSMNRVYANASAHGTPWEIVPTGWTFGLGSAVFKQAPRGSTVMVGGRPVPPPISVEEQILLEQAIPRPGVADWGMLSEVIRA